MRRMSWCIAMLGAGSCHDEPRWTDIHATELHVNGFVAEIPAGWRDAHELVKPIKTLDLAGSRTILLERGDAFGEIDVFTFPVVITSETPCEKLQELWSTEAHQIPSTISSAERATIAGDPGCLMKLTVAK